MIASRGVCYIVLGAKAEAAAKMSIQALRRNHPELPIAVIASGVIRDSQNIYYVPAPPSFHGLPAKSARYSKTLLPIWSPYDQTLYLDADTMPNGNIMAGFDALDAGFEFVIVPSKASGSEWQWHVGEPERQYTADALGYLGLELGGGVFYFRKTEAVQAFFEAWSREWLVYQGEDQCALLRALACHPLKLWLLGYPFNGGAAIGHRWGAVRE